MSSPLSRFVRMLMLALVLGLASARPAAAQSDDSGPTILRDTETEALFSDIAKPLVEAANLDNKSVKVVLLNDDEIKYHLNELFPDRPWENFKARLPKDP